MPEFNDEQKKEIKEMTTTTIREYNQVAGFTDRKITDTPTDALSVVNRRFVTLNGAIASRPVSSVATVGQQYFATDSSVLMIYATTGWVDPAGSIIALNN